jgi:3'(2'), 5'-bisphosphate nucleotidase
MYNKQSPAAEPADVCDWIDAGNGQVANRFWTLDPIDGTKGFLRGGQYAVALALIENRQVQVAALACPALSETLAAGTPADNGESVQTGVVYIAVRGQGAMAALLGSTRFKTIQVAAPDHNLRFVESVEAAHSDLPLQSEIATVIGIADPPLQLDSQVKYGVVAHGDAALYLRLPADNKYIEKIWDHAAGSLIVEEAGGHVSDMWGRPLNFADSHLLRDNQGVIVSRGNPLHKAVLDTIADVKGK